MTRRSHILEVWGDFACFSRPELKVERFSYPVITPSAARGIFDAIYCKPVEFRWQVTCVEVLSPPGYIALRRNEVKEKVNARAVAEWMAGKKPPEPIFADVDRTFWGTDVRGRTQRQTMALKDVHYRLHARIHPWTEFQNRQAALDSQFQRRARSGKCFQQPYFGCREFPAYFRLVEEEIPAPAPIQRDMEIGWMLYDVFDLSRPGKNSDEPAISVFRADLRQGVLEIPSYADDAVRKPKRRPS